MNNSNRLNISIIIAALIVGGAIMYQTKYGKPPTIASKTAQTARTTFFPNEATIVNGGRLLPLPAEKAMAGELVRLGVIDPARLPQATELNLLWAFGLANKNAVLEKGPMMDPQYGGVDRFASTGGWTAGKGSPMDHYGHHALMELNPEQQALVEKVAKKTFRPCCKNSAYFPDCNHGMAMLGLLEIKAYQGANEAELEAAALRANQEWFPEVYGYPPTPSPASGGCSV